MARLLNQRLLATVLGVSRATIIAWGKEGLPIAKRNGAGREVLYDEGAVQRWCLLEGKGCSWQAIGAKARKAELLRPDPRSADVCTGIAEVELARAMGRALVALLQDLDVDEWPRYQEVFGDLIGLYTTHLAFQLSDIGFPAVEEIYFSKSDEIVWPTELEECRARARAEVPR